MIDWLWLLPLLPFVAAALGVFLAHSRPRQTAYLAIGAMGLALVLALIALGTVMGGGPGQSGFRETQTFDWFALGVNSVQLGWVLDPLGAVMVAMVTLVGLLIFVYSLGYMAHDPRLGRFFCFLALFAGAMLGLVLANSLLLLFICWELVGVASYLLIGFWYQKPEAAAAAKKAFITTRVGDLGLLLGMVWLYAETGTLLFYDDGRGCLESDAIGRLVTMTTVGGLGVSTAIGLLVFCGAIGKSGQVPLHVWLPDAMEGPTPVSALIHAATMVAAGVFLVARVYPLMAAVPPGSADVSVALKVVTWVGAFTAFFAALVAVGQTDIKRILAYSTVSQLGYMFVGLGVGGVAVGMFHLVTHAFFKALLFLGAGSVIHGCHDEQDIRRMGGLRRWMPVTFWTYAVGMLALSGVPVLAGFWSKDEILHAARDWPVSLGPYLLVLAGAWLTAFYMTRQMATVFCGDYRGAVGSVGEETPSPHESPRVMTVPLVILAGFSVLLGFWGTPLAPAFQHLLGANHGAVSAGSVVGMMLISVTVVGLGLAAGWQVYGRVPRRDPLADDPLETVSSSGFQLLLKKFWIDELYARTVVRWISGLGRAWLWLDRVVLDSLVDLIGYVGVGLAWLSRLLDEYGINPAFDGGCRTLKQGGGATAKWHDGRIPNALRVLGLAFAILVLLMTWGCSR